MHAGKVDAVEPQAVESAEGGLRRLGTLARAERRLGTLARSSFLARAAAAILSECFRRNQKNSTKTKSRDGWRECLVSRVLSASPGKLSIATLIAKVGVLSFASVLVLRPICCWCMPKLSREIATPMISA